MPFFNKHSANGMVVALSQLISSIAFAQSSPAQVAAECTRQMSAGICYTRTNRSTLTAGQTLVLSGAGRVAMSAYLDYMDLYDLKNPEDSAMCRLALKYMKSEPGGDHDKIARALWTPQTPNQK